MAKLQYMSKCWFPDLSNVSRTIYEIGKETAKSVYLKRSKNQYADTPSLVKLFFLSYQSAARPGEMLQSPMPTAKEIGWNRRIYVELTKVNEKHFTAYHIDHLSASKKPVYRGNGEHAPLTQYLPLDDEYDKAMWDYIFDGGLTMDLGFLNAFTGYNEQNRKNVGGLITRNFTHNLTDGTMTSDGKERIYKNAGIPPNLLRHSRVYNLLCNKMYPREAVGNILGWNPRDVNAMIATYTYIDKQLKGTTMLKFMDSFLTKANAPSFKLGTDLSDSST